MLQPAPIAPTHVQERDRSNGGQPPALRVRATAAATPPALPMTGEATLARIRRGMGARHRGSPAEWLQGLGEGEREEMRLLGRRLVVLASDYVGRPRERRQLIAEAREIGASYGRTLAGHGTPFSTLLEAFLFFRHLLEEAVLGRGSGGSAGGEGPRLLAGLLDKVLLAAVAGYEEAPPARFAILPFDGAQDERPGQKDRGDAGAASDQIAKRGAGAGDNPLRYHRIGRAQHNGGAALHGDRSDGSDRG